MTTGFKEIKALDLPNVEEEILRLWEKEQTFHESIRSRRNCPSFTFYEGPPTANGRPGIHHVLGRTIKDVFCRYKTLKGFRVDRKGGWDTHGLPVEIEVEKELGLDGREQVERFGIGEFNKACKESVLRYKKEWDDLTERIGYWVDLENPYITFQSEYIESVWWLLKKIHEKGLLYKGHKIQWYSPGNETVLSSHEVALGYKEVLDPSVYVRFKSEEEDVSFLAWTTTPWTLIANVGIVVSETTKYVTVRSAGERLILAEARLGVLDEDYEIESTFLGKELIGRRYEPLYRLEGIEYGNQSHRIYGADYVTVEDGTGLVHIAPAFGDEDSEVGKKQDLPLVNPIQPDGKFVEGTPLVEGLWFKDAEKPIIDDLKKRHLLYKREDYLHNYPHDWRKGTPLMSYPVDSWFVSTTKIKEQLVQLNQTVNWHPHSIRDGRFGNWLENNVDWALSRKRYWGTPLPIWVSDREDSSYFEVIGSIDELRAKSQVKIPEGANLDLHRPYVDAITWEAPDGGTMRRVPDVLDVWFDSGAMPFAQWHYPFDNKKVFEKNFPADFICEGVDQTRGWFYTLHAIAGLVMGQVAFRNVVVNGLVLDEKGEKMSKSKGNSVNPFEIVATYGADVVRWYLMSNSPPWDNMKFAERGLAETRGKVFGTIANVYRFMASYANIDGFRFGEDVVPLKNREELDRWVISRLHSTMFEVDKSFENYDATSAARKIEQFVDELSNWYIRRSRPRFWASKKESETTQSVSVTSKMAAYETTYDCLYGLAIMMAPISPFFSDWLYRRLDEGSLQKVEKSVHLATYPECDQKSILPALEERVRFARQIVQLALLLRNRCKINVRQPLARILIVTGPSLEQVELEKVSDLILDEINVQRIDYVQDSSKIVRRSIKPDFKKLGPRLGRWMKASAAVLGNLDDEAIGKFLKDGSIVISVDSREWSISIDEVQVLSEEIGDLSVAQEGEITIALDTTINLELLNLGYAREVINRVQSLRKNADLALTDLINIQFSASEDLAVAVEKHGDLICRETLARSITSDLDAQSEGISEFDFNGQQLRVIIETTK